jgi:Fe-S-cluster containining protein
MVRTAVSLKLAGISFKTQVAVPKGPTTLRQLLPVLRGFTQAITHTAVQSAEAAGRHVSCKAGCGACCRQLVPITQTEAHVLAELVAAMPEPRRSVILGRFAAAIEKLKAAGLLEQVEKLLSGKDAKKSLGLTYFAQQIPCPFLEDESCSIHADRPLICREYLVTNDPKFCANPSKETIRTVALPGAISAAMAKAQGSGQQVALVLALEWAAQHPETPAKRTGPELLQEVLGCLTGTKSEIDGGATGLMGKGDKIQAPSS